MIILKEDSNMESSIQKLVNTIKDNFENNNKNFDIKIDGFHCWCDNDKDVTAFIEYPKTDAYATVTQYEIDNDYDNCASSIKEQIEGSGSTDEDYEST